MVCDQRPRKDRQKWRCRLGTTWELIVSGCLRGVKRRVVRFELKWRCVGIELFAAFRKILRNRVVCGLKRISRFDEDIPHV